MKSANLNLVNKPVQKKDAMALITGKPVYTDDLAPKDCLIVKIMRSPHAHAIIKEIDTSKALAIDGVECVLTYKDIPQKRFTLAGQTYPEFSPYDRYILEDRVRYVGDSVAIVAAVDEKTAEKAIDAISVKYELLEHIIDIDDAIDNKTIIHPEDDWKANVPIGSDKDRNICASGKDEHGDVDYILDNCDYVIEETYHTKAVQQAMMETFRSFAYIDAFDRLTVVASTQIPFHVRRIVSNALDIPKSKIRIIKPRIGGGFGAKQTAITEIYTAIVTYITKKPSKCIYTRYESQSASTPRHEMKIRVKIGADKTGKIRAIDMHTLSNTGAYGEHGPTTVGLSGHKTIPLYTGGLEAFRFSYDVVYTNRMSAGAYRGYGATQGTFAMESAVNELATKIGINPLKLREINQVKSGMIMNAYYGETLGSCSLDRCLVRMQEMIDWNEKYPSVKISDTKIRAVGMAMTMQGSGISNVDKGAVTLKINDDGFYSMNIGATDMGTGCDTILAQIVGEVMMCPLENVIVNGVDTDTSPYDSGSYASATTYVTGLAAFDAAQELKYKITEVASKILKADKNIIEFKGDKIENIETGEFVLLKDLANDDMAGNSNTLEVTKSNSSPISPPPFMVSAVELDVDIETGEIELVDFVSVVDCGVAINPNLVRVQAEGGIAQSIGMALTEDVIYDSKGRLLIAKFMDYKIPTRLDVGKIRVEFEESYEESGPFGAKSIGEVVINTAGPAIAHAIFNATGVYHRELPITAEKIVRSLYEID